MLVLLLVVLVSFCFIEAIDGREREGVRETWGGGPCCCCSSVDDWVGVGREGEEGEADDAVPLVLSALLTLVPGRELLQAAVTACTGCCCVDTCVGCT